MENKEISTPLGLLNKDAVLVEVQGPKIGSINKEIDIWTKQTLNLWKDYEFKKDLWGQSHAYYEKYHYLCFYFNNKHDAMVFKLLSSN
jgi:hypothetical protein